MVLRGLFLVAYAASLALVVHAGAPAPAAMLVIAGNAAWAVASVIVVAADWLTLTTTGTVVALLQAAAVAVFAELQLVGSRHIRRD